MIKRNIAKNPRYDAYQGGLALMFYTFFYKKLLAVVLKMRISQTKNYLKNYANQLLKRLKNGKYTHLL